MARTSASAVAAPLSANATPACPPSRADLLLDAVKLVPPRMRARRYSLSSSSLRPARRLARSFLVHGETSAAAARRWTAAGTRQVLTFPRFSLARQLRVPLSASPTPLSTASPPSSALTRAVVALFPPSVVLPPRAVFLSPSLVTVLLHAPVFIFPSAPFRPYRPASISFCCPRANFLHTSERFSTHSTFPSQLLRKLLNPPPPRFSIKLHFRHY